MLAGVVAVVVAVVIAAAAATDQTEKVDRMATATTVQAWYSNAEEVQREGRKSVLESDQKVVAWRCAAPRVG